MPLNQSDYISLAALGVASLSALYARWASKAAKYANQISLQVHKVEIYEEVVSFSDCFRGLFNVPNEERLERFKNNAVQRAEIYLSNETYLQIKEIYEHCKEKEIWLSIAESEGAERCNAPNDLEIRSQYKSVLNLLYPVIDSIKKETVIKHA